MKAKVMKAAAPNKVCRVAGETLVPGFRLIQGVQVLTEGRDDAFIFVGILAEDVLDNHDGFLHHIVHLQHTAHYISYPTIGCALLECLNCPSVYSVLVYTKHEPKAGNGRLKVLQQCMSADWLLLNHHQ